MNGKRFSGMLVGKKVIEEGATRNIIARETFKNISELNVSRGNLKGFIFEHLHAKEMNYELMKKGLKAEVIDNNGLADILVRDMKTGKIIQKIQAKCGYEGGIGDVARYTADSQTLVINGDSKNLAQNLTKKGIKFEKSSITNTEASSTANLMRKEGTLLGSKKAMLTSKGLHTKEIIKNGHRTGLNAAKNGAIFGAGVSIGANFVEIIRGDKEIGEAVADVAVDSTIAGAAGYVAGATGSFIASTSAGSAAIGAVSSGLGTLASTSAGSAAIGAASTLATGITTVTGAVTGAIAASTSSIGSAVGATAIGGLASAAASTAVGTAVITGVAAATPILIGGALIGGFCSFIGGLFD